MSYKIKGLNIFTVLRYISQSNYLLNPEIIPTNILARLDADACVLFSFQDARTVSVCISEEKLSEEAEERFERFCDKIKILGYEVKNETCI